MLHYIIQVLLFQTLFLAAYDLFLKKETFFQWNRAYLIVSSILAYVIPLIKIERANAYVQENFIALPEVILNPEMIFLNEVNLTKGRTTIFTLQNLYILGISIALLLFIYKISLIFIKIYKNTILKEKDYNLVILPKQETAFSFFKYLFLGKPLFEKEHQHIIKHELTHIKQKHSIDLIYFELQKIVFWFNPFSYLFQNRISALHEYIADAKTIKEDNKQTFFKSLLNQTFQIEKFSFVNQFYKKSLIKKRIIMATKNKSKEILKLKYLLIIPLLASMLLYTSCEKTEEIKQETDSKVYDIKELDKSPYLEGSTAEESERKIEMVVNISQEIFKHAKQIKSDDIKSNYLAFVINESGKVESIDYSNISKEDKTIAKEIISSLPNFKPGIKNGKPVKTLLKIPFIGYTDVKEEKETISFSTIENVPVYPGCSGTNEELRKCMSKKITQHVSKTFDVGLANTLNLKSGKKRISIQFKIDKDGNVADIKARAPHPKLEAEAIRIIKSLPKMQAGKQDGKAVNVRYNLPIIFNVED